MTNILYSTLELKYAAVLLHLTIESQIGLPREQEAERSPGRPFMEDEGMKINRLMKNIHSMHNIHCNNKHNMNCNSQKRQKQ